MRYANARRESAARSQRRRRAAPDREPGRATTEHQHRAGLWIADTLLNTSLSPSREGESSGADRDGANRKRLALLCRCRCREASLVRLGFLARSPHDLIQVA